MMLLAGCIYECYARYENIHMSNLMTVVDLSNIYSIQY